MPEEWAEAVGLIDWDITVTPPPRERQLVVVRGFARFFMRVGLPVDITPFK